jgi:hypothetical protein
MASSSHSVQRDHVFGYHPESEPLLMAEEVGLRAGRLISDSSLVTRRISFPAAHDRNDSAAALGDPNEITSGVDLHGHAIDDI